MDIPTNLSSQQGRIPERISSKYRGGDSITFDKEVRVKTPYKRRKPAKPAFIPGDRSTTESEPDDSGEVDTSNKRKRRPSSPDDDADTRKKTRTHTVANNTLNQPSRQPMPFKGGDYQSILSSIHSN